MKLIISPIFENLTIPISCAEENELAESLIHEGCKEPITVWNDILLDGHKRYKICMMEHIDFDVQKIACKTKEEAIIWVCRKRTAELSRGSQAFRYLMGKWYLSEVELNRTQKKTRMRKEDSNDKRERHRTSDLMSKEVGFHHSTLEKYGSVATALDILTQIEPLLLEAIMTDALFISQKDILKLACMDEKNRHNEIRKLLRSASQKAKIRYTLEERRTAKQAEEQNSITLSIGIKEMPSFNPDMELQGLTLTIPTWITVMERTIRRSDMSLVTDEAKENLRTVLTKLNNQIKTITEALI